MIDKIKKFSVGNVNNNLLFQFTGIIKYIPLIVCGGFFLLTIFIFAFGPLDWSIENPYYLYGFLFFCCIALILGYLLAIKKGKTETYKINLDINKILIICASVYFIFYIPTLLTTTGKWYPDIVTGLMNSGIAYKLSAYYSLHSSHLVMYLRILFSPLMIMVIPITLLFWPKLSTTAKVMGVTTIILSFLLGISQGINKSCADITAQIVLVLMILFFSNNHKGSKIFYRLKIISLIILMCSLFFAYNITIMRNRITTDISLPDDFEITTKELNASIDAYSTFGSAVINDQNIILKLIPDELESSVVYLLSYISHGYKGLSIALDQNFTSSYGLGFSDFFRRNISKLFDQPNFEDVVYSRTYMAKTTKLDWPVGLVWSTFFVYPASDISFYGTIALIFLIGYLFALSWKDALKTHNPFAIVAFNGFCMMIFYFSANNQMFQSGENFVGFSVVLLLWFISRLMLKRKLKTSAL